MALHARRYELTQREEFILPQLLDLVLLGRDDDARELLADAAKDHPDSLPIKKMVEAGVVDRLVADPQVKERRL